jgi:SAM-dependent methyltransferase
VVQGNTLEVQCAVECFGLLYLNPPYDWALGPADSRRTEQAFLSHIYRWLKPGGALIFVIPVPGERRTRLGTSGSSQPIKRTCHPRKC